MFLFLLSQLKAVLAVPSSPITEGELRRLTTLTLSSSTYRINTITSTFSSGIVLFIHPSSSSSNFEVLKTAPAVGEHSWKDCYKV